MQDFTNGEVLNKKAENILSIQHCTTKNAGLNES